MPESSNGLSREGLSWDEEDSLPPLRREDLPTEQPIQFHAMETDLEDSSRKITNDDEKGGEPMYGQSQQVDVSAFDIDDHLLDDDTRVPFSWRKLVAFSGPGILM